MTARILENPEPASADTDARSTVLIVDDDEALSDALSRRLQQQGFVTLVADSGAEGLATARSELPSLILLDLRLPDRDGFEICRELADSPDTCGIPVIILSGLERPDIVRQCRSVGCHYFVRKPYDPNALLVLIRQSIEEAGAWDDFSQ
jgi:DNA-binding response OmpR family regulator